VALEALAGMEAAEDRASWPDPQGPAITGFYREFDAFVGRYMDIAYDDEALDRRPDLLLRIVLELSTETDRKEVESADRSESLEQRLLDAVGPEREAEARDVIRVGRLSWRLRDDDNILMGRLGNQLRRVLDLGAARLRSQGRLIGPEHVPYEAAEAVSAALRDSPTSKLWLPRASEEPTGADPLPPGQTPRQLIGQPAAPGLVTGRARIVRRAGDIGEFERGEILVCDAIQPTMTQLVPIAGGIIERRGGMLIHGAIIARELGVPCVNGVVDATESLRDGDLLTVDGYLGIVTVGPPEFDLERIGDSGVDSGA
jgi:pyruvate,water dikinase